jgi:hypothetical protein
LRTDRRRSRSSCRRPRCRDPECRISPFQGRRSPISCRVVSARFRQCQSSTAMTVVMGDGAGQGGHPQNPRAPSLIYPVPESRRKSGTPFRSPGRSGAGVTRPHGAGGGGVPRWLAGERYAAVRRLTAAPPPHAASGSPAKGSTTRYSGHVGKNHTGLKPVLDRRKSPKKKGSDS